MVLESYTVKLCACGQPLHYPNAITAKFMELTVQRCGELVTVSLGGRKWLVPRHYIALHGLKAADLGTAAVPPFEEVTAGRGK